MFAVSPSVQTQKGKAQIWPFFFWHFQPNICCNFPVASQYWFFRTSLFQVFISSSNVLSSCGPLGLQERVFLFEVSPWAVFAGTQWAQVPVKSPPGWRDKEFDGSTRFRNWKHALQWRVCQETLQIRFHFWNTFLAVNLCWYQLSVSVMWNRWFPQ